VLDGPFELGEVPAAAAGSFAFTGPSVSVAAPLLVLAVSDLLVVAVAVVAGPPAPPAPACPLFLGGLDLLLSLNPAATTPAVLLCA